jgi:hypothetical protein
LTRRTPVATKKSEKKFENAISATTPSAIGRSFASNHGEIVAQMCFRRFGSASPEQAGLNRGSQGETAVRPEVESVADL